MIVGKHHLNGILLILGITWGGCQADPITAPLPIDQAPVHLESDSLQRRGSLENESPEYMAPVLRNLLKKKGLTPTSAPTPNIQSGPLRVPYAGETVSDPDGIIVSGLIIRFHSEEAKARSRANQPPPADLLESTLQASLVPMAFSRAMSSDAFVFQFMTPQSLREVQTTIEALKNLHFIELVEPDTRMQASLTPNDPYFYNQWPLFPPYIYQGGVNAELAWNMTTGSAETVVAVVDTGITNPASYGPGRVLPGYDFISDPYRANDGDGRDADARDPGDWHSPGECVGRPMKWSSWHGSHVAGTIAAPGNNGSGIAGVNWKTRILPIRVLGKCGGDASDIIDGMKWAAGLPIPGVPNNSNPARVINMSLGGPSPTGCTKIYQEAINQVKSRNAIIVVAAGNDEEEAAKTVPASCDGVITVGAIDHLGFQASYSNYSLLGKVTISAPGGDISYYGHNSYGVLSTVDAGSTVPVGILKYDYQQGTSMAAPHVSGVASLAMALDPEQHAHVIGALMALLSRPFPGGTLCSILDPLCGKGMLDAYNTLLGVEAIKPYRLVWDFFNPDLNHYFRTAGIGEPYVVLSGQVGRWMDKGDYFFAWKDSSEGAVPVCRFYGTPGIGPNSHFYTASPSECEIVKNDPGWTYEGIAFYIKRPVNKICPQDTTPIHRYYNNRHMYNDANHRYTTHVYDRNSMILAGWTYEGVVMCAL